LNIYPKTSIKRNIKGEAISTLNTVL